MLWVHADQPRIVQHVDDTFRRTVCQLYRQTIPANGAVLDLMSSWVSHLPEDIPYSLVVGHGMNAQEVRQCWNAAHMASCTQWYIYVQHQHWSSTILRCWQ